MIKLENEARDTIIREAVSAYPNECFGFVFGYDDENGRRIITHAAVMDNGEKKTRFSISPHDYTQAEKYAGERQLQLMGVYHSHPDHPAIPSQQDRLAAQPFFSYLIISVTAKEAGAIRSWRLNDDGNFEEENYHLLAL
jgi:Predicted metal-dependent protease of the PAD1/JAB1 superfamily